MLGTDMAGGQWRSESRRAFVYLDFVPRDQGSGADLRCYSNIRALLDLGYAVELLVVGGEPAALPLAGALARAKLSQVDLTPDDAGLRGRIAFRFALPTRAAFRYAFPGHRQLLRELRSRMVDHPEALHFIEGERNASVLPFAGGGRIVWSHHDSLADVALATAQIACELAGRGMTSAERRAYRFARRAERTMLAAAPLILTISDADRERLTRTGLSNVELLPMSVPDERPYRLEHDIWARNGTLTLLHLGRTSHLPSYRSLEFLLGGLLPALPDETRRRLRLVIAGAHDGVDARSRHIRELAARYPKEVRMLGFVPGLQSLMLDADVQVVGTAESTGVRTRIIESFAAGLPVLSTSRGAEGIIGLRPGHNILIADDAKSFGRALEDLLAAPAALRSIATAGRTLYVERYGRIVVARTLHDQLRRHGLF